MAFADTDASQTVTWRSLPRKDQLSLLFFSRLVDILQATSIQTYVFYYVKHLNPDPSVPPSSSQAGLLLGSFTGAQFVTTLLWARIADSRLVGRRGVLLVGLAGTAMSCLGFGFSRSFKEALACRVLGGALNAIPSMVGVMTSEIVEEKKLQPLAFLLQPMSFGVAAFLGPAIGGLTADPVSNYKKLFGPGSIIGGEFGVQWMVEYPFALANILSAIFIILAGVFVVLCLEETLQRPRSNTDIELSGLDGEHVRRELPFLKEKTVKGPHVRIIWTSKFMFTLFSLASFDFHTSAFNNILPLFLSTPPATPSATERYSLPFIFSGGLGMPSSSIGAATALVGAIGLVLQTTLYPQVQQRFGTVTCYQTFSLLFPLTYAFIPFVAFCGGHEGGAGLTAWCFIILLLLLHVIGRTVVLPTGAVLLNDCSTHAESLSRVHGIGRSFLRLFERWALLLVVIGMEWE